MNSEEMVAPVWTVGADDRELSKVKPHLLHLSMRAEIARRQRALRDAAQGEWEIEMRLPLTENSRAPLN